MLKYYHGQKDDEESKYFNVEDEKLCMREDDLFYHNDSILFRNKVYALGKENFNVFDTIKKTWDLVSNYDSQNSFLNSEESKSEAKSSVIKVTRTKLSLYNL